METHPFQRILYGLSGSFRPGKVWETAKPLMDRLWEVIRKEQLPTEGINHWLYSGGGQIFVGVEMRPGSNDPTDLEKRTVRMEKSVSWKHHGSFSDITKGHQILQDEIRRSGHRQGELSLEIYGHVQDDDPLSEMQIIVEIG